MLVPEIFPKSSPPFQEKLDISTERKLKKLFEYLEKNLNRGPKAISSRTSSPIGQYIQKAQQATSRLGVLGHSNLKKMERAACPSGVHHLLSGRLTKASNALTSLVEGKQVMLALLLHVSYLNPKFQD